MRNKLDLDASEVPRHSFLAPEAHLVGRCFCQRTEVKCSDMCAYYLFFLIF